MLRQIFGRIIGKKEDAARQDIREVQETKPEPKSTSMATPHKLTEAELNEDPFNSPRLVDISSGGGRLHAPISGINKGDKVRITLYCLGSERFDFDAEVRWTNFPKDKSYMEFGIQFGQLVDLADVEKISRSTIRTRYKLISLARAAA